MIGQGQIGLINLIKLIGRHGRGVRQAFYRMVRFTGLAGEIQDMNTGLDAATCTAVYIRIETLSEVAFDVFLAAI